MCTFSRRQELCHSLNMALRFLSNSKQLLAIRNAHAFAPNSADVLSSSNVTESTTLKNGIKVAVNNNGRPMTTVGVWIDSGSRYETEENNGVANLVEHLLYKGTNKRSQVQLETELGKIGARLSSVTSREHTAYFAQAPSGKVEQVVEILADVLRNSKFSESNIEKEKQILLNKLDEVENDYQEVVFDNLHATAFQGTPLAKSIYGTTETIQNLSRNDVLNFIDDHYKPVRMAISAVGGVNTDTIVNLSEKYFGDLKNEYKRKIPNNYGTRFTGSEYRYRNDYIPYMYGAYAVEGVGASSKDALPLKIASSCVGQWDKTYGALQNSPSTLIQKMSTKGHIQLFNSFSINYRDTGLFGFYFVHEGNDLDDVTNAVRVIQREWKRICTSATEDDFHRAKQALKTQIFTSYATSLGLAEKNAKDLLNKGEVQQLSDLMNEINQISCETIRDAVTRNVYDRDFASAAVGKTEAWPDYQHIRYGMSWWRL
ncbi:Cytochrome b-c1 complex subunit 1, mitochondrial [Strongyloides ratti]|uniref:Cytochrome b-c1 complex subunit 1, mitochondrial n=1 Tax=Strongyloides ratti TaxID=34506 RepID=A0A090MYC2_STRRB|nr:Cytochrome b-c1 complex subunit 1, mitochondrial [Strongyloides ratti]CEF66929.1 Cytochrome b-c1 complex subunit 1, mitochondrial [Strongyloides ratti]